MSDIRTVEHFNIEWKLDFWGSDSGWVSSSRGDIEIMFSHVTCVQPCTVSLVRLDNKTKIVSTWFGLSSEEQKYTEFVPIGEEKFYVTRLSCGAKLYLKEDLLEGIDK